MNAKRMRMVIAMLVAMATLGAGQSKSADKGLTVADLRAQQPDEAIKASAQCVSAREKGETPGRVFFRHHTIDPRTLSLSLDDLMRDSDEVILGGVELHIAVLLSPSGDSATTYYEVRVIRTWKGSHNIGDRVTFGVPVGYVNCGRNEEGHILGFPNTFEDEDWKDFILGKPSVLFLRHPEGGETQLAQSFILTGGEGLQGAFPIHVRATEEAASKCNGALAGTIQWCDSFLDTSQLPILFPLVHDPLAKKYDAMPISKFLKEVRAVAADQGLDEKSASMQ